MGTVNSVHWENNGHEVSASKSAKKEVDIDFNGKSEENIKGKKGRVTILNGFVNHFGDRKKIQMA